MKKLLKDNKAFTLVEVITTITILSIIMAIAVGSVDGLVKNSKKKAMQSSASNYVDAINLAIVNDEIDSEHIILEGSIYQEYITSANSVDKYSDIIIDDGVLQQANFCFKDGLVTYYNGKYDVYLNDDCKQSVIADTVTNAYSIDKDNKVNGIPVFIGDSENSTISSSYEEAPYKLYMTSDEITVNNTTNAFNNSFCNKNSSNCDYRCIDGVITYDDKGNITSKNNCNLKNSGIITSAYNQKNLSLSWALSLGYSIDSYFWLRGQRNQYGLTSFRYFDYATSSDGFDIGVNNPYLYKGFCDDSIYVNSEEIYNYCQKNQVKNRLIGEKSNYFKTKQILLNGIYPYRQNKFPVALAENTAVKDTSYLDSSNVNYDIKEYLKYGAVDFSNNTSVDSSISQKINNIKELVSNSSGVVIISSYGENFAFYNKEINAIYQEKSNTNSVVDQTFTVVGWDDNKFINGKRGAWIVITSNGNYSDEEEASNAGVNKNGFTYISYYDYGYLSNEHFAFIKIEDVNNKNTKVYNIYNSSYEKIEGSTTAKLKNVVGKEYATNLIFDRIDSKNYKETLSQIKIYNQFSVETAYKIYLKQNEVYNEIGFVHFDNNEAGFKTIKLTNQNIKLDGDKIDIIVTISSQIPINNLVLLPEDFALFTEISETEEIDMKVLYSKDSVSKEIELNILTNNISTGNDLEFTVTKWDGTVVKTSATNTKVINDFYTGIIILPSTEKYKISIGYNGTVYQTITVNSSNDVRPKCKFSISKLTLYEEQTSIISLTCIDDVGLRSSNLSNTILIGDLSINSWYAEVHSISPPRCSNRECEWDIKVQGNRKGNTTLKLGGNSVYDTNNQGNFMISIPVEVKR